MSPALTSANSFRLVGSRKPPGRRHCAAVVHASKSGFRFGKQQSVAGNDGAVEKTEKKKPFFVDIKLPEVSKSLIPAAAAGSSFLARRRKDPNAVFVAGASGQAGVRIVQRLLRQGFAVRAGVPDLATAQELARIAAVYKVISPAESKRLNAVESPFGDAEAIARAIGSATSVVVTVGPGEKGPAVELTTSDALSVIRAAALAGVAHIVVICDTSSGDSTNNVLDGVTSFFSNLFSRAQAPTPGDLLRTVAEETDVAFTFVRAALTDDYNEESRFRLVVAKEGSGVASSPGEFKVPMSQIADLVAVVFSNMSAAENKVVELTTTPSETTKSIAELLSEIPADGRRRLYKEAAAEKAKEAAAAARELKVETKKLTEEKAEEEDWKERASAAGASLDGLLKKAKGIGGQISWEKLVMSSQFGGAGEATNGKPGGKAAQIATVRGQAKAQKLPPKKAVLKPPPPPPPPKKKPEPEKTEVRSVFGIFKQETIYVDE